MNQYYTTPYPVYQAPANMAQNRSNGIIWVNGEEGARAYVMSPNSNAILFDAEKEGRFYIKTTDNIGMCTAIRLFDYQEILDVNPLPREPQHTNVQYATKQDVQELRQMIEALKGGMHEQSVQSTQYSSVPATTY